MNLLSLPRHHPEEVKNRVGWDGLLADAVQRRLCRELATLSDILGPGKAWLAEATTQRSIVVLAGSVAIGQKE
jgi:hypothetical protein